MDAVLESSRIKQKKQKSTRPMPLQKSCAFLLFRDWFDFLQITVIWRGVSRKSEMFHIFKTKSEKPNLRVKQQ